MKQYLILLLLVLILPSFTNAQDAADYEFNGVTYYYATGAVDSGHMNLGMDYTGENQQPFFGCNNLYLRDGDGVDNGRVQMLGQYNGTHFFIDMSRFEGIVDGTDAGIVQDIFVDGSRTHVGEIQHPAVFAGLAAWGTGYLQINLNNTYYDPVTGNDEFRVSLFVTPEGFRDNETGAVYAQDGSIYEPGDAAILGDNDWEMHLRLESLGGQRAPPVTWTEVRPEGDPGYFTPTDAYSEVIVFQNQRFGGTLSFDVLAESLAPDGENRLDFILRDPHGLVIDEFSGSPSALDTFTYSGEAPLDKFGYYTLQAIGEVSLSRFEVDFQQNSPDTFDMDFWWDNVTFGGYGSLAMDECREIVGDPSGKLVASVVPQELPPAFDWVPIGFGTLGTILGIVIGGKLLAMSLVAKR